MKKIISSFLLCFALLEVLGQVNLVPNPSFEDHTDCPQGYPDLDGKLNDWMSFRGTPDYFNNCSEMNGYNNNWGYQEPHSGEGFTGFNTYQVTIVNAKEHLGTQLISPLIIGEKYYISFYVSTAYTPLQMNIATNKIGGFFTTSPYYYPLNPGDAPVSLSNTAHLNTDSIISDTTNWLKISGSIIADSAYNYIVIGSFFDDDNTDTLHLPYQVVPQIAYYYLDDVCVSTDSLYTQNWTTLSINEINKNKIVVYPNPASDYLIITMTSFDTIDTIEIYNASSQHVLCKTFSLIDEEYQLDLSNLDAGFYWINIKTKNGSSKSMKLVINSKIK